ncbi:hypothetical protein ACWD0J_05180 [Streptomyces sp. NPDC003011]
MTATATPQPHTVSHGYRALKVTDVWGWGEELFAMEVDGHVAARVALAAANRYARREWGYLSLTRESREQLWGLGYEVTGCRQLYIRTLVCLTKHCHCEGYGHVQDATASLPGARPVTRIDIY